MKKTILALLLLSTTVYAEGLNDYGELLNSAKFSTHCVVSDPGISGSKKIDVYSNGQISCIDIQTLYSEAYNQIYNFFSLAGFDFTKNNDPKSLNLRIVTLADLNNPTNFSMTDKRCMFDAGCESGAYFGRTFYSNASSNINTYIVYSTIKGKYSFKSTLKHELVHDILYRYRWNRSMDEATEHKLIDRFILWSEKGR